MLSLPVGRAEYNPLKVAKYGELGQMTKGISFAKTADMVWARANFKRTYDRAHSGDGPKDLRQELTRSYDCLFRSARHELAL
jgi:hypothetical protein